MTTPWYAWALVILGPFACAGAGAWVAWLFLRQAHERALDRAWRAGHTEGYRWALNVAGPIAPAVPTILVKPGIVTCRAGHTDYCPACHADAALDRIRAGFDGARVDLGLVPDLWPGFDTHPPALLLAVEAGPGVIP